jgi:acetyl-CoA carboxylase biotin carboxylase subunit
MKKVLIANRGEIALRIVRACQELGIQTVAAFSQADRSLKHLDRADETVCIGKHSYMDIVSLLAAATSRGCDAVHPGYGFLSESAIFSAEVERAGLTFVGPSSAHIALMGDKIQARRFMAENGLPVLLGSESELDDEVAGHLVADRVGYPVMLKASHGGGGRGIAIARNAQELSSVFDSIKNQAQALFGNGAVYIERYLTDARHIEIQVFGDGAGKVIHFGARECSIQRYHQKLVEEAPPPGIPAQEVQHLAEACCHALAKSSYRSAGTLEFLYQDGAFYFIEMNTRIQVEHPITECITGVDLVKLQLSLASESPIPFEQKDIKQFGHAIECRINAEDEHFKPSPGLIAEFDCPGGPGIRMDTHIYSGYRVPHHYDSLLGKLIAVGSDRAEAISRMKRGLSELVIKPLQTNIDLHKKILRDERFVSGSYTTNFIGTQ